MSSKKKIIIICIVVVLVLAAIGVGIFFFLNRAKEYTITYNTDGGTKIETSKVKEDSIVQLPKDPIKEGYIFLHWVDENGKAVLENFKATKDTTLIAIWTEEGAETVTVTFDTDGGSEIKDLEIVKGEKIILPENPTKDGYTFKKWMYNGKEFDKDMTIEENITIKAEWEKKEENKEEKKEEKKEETKQGTIEATGITLNKSSVDLIIGNSGSLTATVTPDNAKDKSVTWSSSDSSIISVDGSGNLKANKIGEATITAKTSNGKTATAKVYSDVESITLSVSNYYISSYGGEKSATLTVTTKPKVSDASISWNAPNTGTAHITPFGATAQISADSASSMTENVVSAYVGRKTSNKVKVYVEPELSLNFESGLYSTVGTDPSRRVYCVKNGARAKIASNTRITTWNYSDGSHLISNPSRQELAFVFTAKNDGDSNESFTLTAVSQAGQTKKMNIKIIVT